MNHGWQSEASDGSKGDWCLLSFSLSFSISLNLSIYLSIYLSTYLASYLSIHPSIHLSIYPSIHLSIYSSIHLSICLSVYLPVYLSVYLSVCLSIHLSLFVYLSTCLSASLKTKLFCEMSSFFKVDNIKIEAILRDFFIFWTYQRQKQSNSARLLHFSNLTTSKTKQFCETSFKNVKLHATLTASYQCVFSFFQSTCLNYCAYHEKVMPGHTKCRTCHAKSSQQTWRFDAPKCNPLRKSAPGPPNSSDEDVSCTAPATENAPLQILFKCPTPAIVCRNATKPLRFAHFWHLDKVHNPLRLPRETWCFVQKQKCGVCANMFAPATQISKMAQTCGALYILTSKCASRHNGVHFFDISTAKSGPELVCFVALDFEMCFAPQRRALFRHLNFQKWSGAGVFCTFLTSKCASRHQLHFFYIATSKCGPEPVCFVHFDFDMCFAPQRRALFRHRNFQKWSEHGVLCTFWLGNVLRATTACNFSSLIWPDGSAPDALASHKSLEKHSVSRLSYLYAHLHLLSSDSFSSLIFSLLLFSSLWLFPSLLFICPYCPKFDFQTSFDNTITLSPLLVSFIHNHIIHDNQYTIQFLCYHHQYYYCY